ncbi:1-phosphofructokinase family hexose kinase [Eubacteriales bacterium mix99]|jgi:tagatose 6-phosphate kinase|nr:1-phosphofructokinase [Clostridiales bacterium]
MILAVNMNPAMDKVYAVDDFQAGKVFRPRDMTATAGGKGLNVARVAHLLGEKVIATGLIGGSTGRQIEEEVRNGGMDSRFVPIRGESRICINIMDHRNGTSTEVLEPGPMATEGDARVFLSRYQELLEECSVVTASGSLPKGLPVDFYSTLIRLAKEKGKRFLLDTSGTFFQEGIKARPFLIKPNRDELTALQLAEPGSRRTGEKAEMGRKDIVKAVQAFQARGIELPVVSLGKQGCIAALEDGVYHFTTPAVDIVNTVGSGDSFIAGCAVALNRGARFREAIRFGMACGTANTQFFKTGWIEKEMVESFLPMIDCIKIA